jgi:hypothetical protein
MIDYLMNKTEKQRAYIGIAACVFIFIFGYYILNYISTREKVPLGNTIYIIIGSTLIATSIIGVVLIIKYIRKINRKRRKRRNSKIVFLKDVQKKNE